MPGPKISIIVPVYKVEDYLRRCIDSILAQTFHDFEILLIDDGSPDRSGEICDEYAVKDKRIKVFHKINGGVSSARNLGLDNAKGKWVAFIDPDDWISDDYLKQDFNVNSDIIQIGYNVISEDNEKILEYGIKEHLLSDSKLIYQYFIQKRNNALWDKFYSQELISNCRFDENVSIGEDFLFTLSLIARVKSYKFSSIGKYNYVKRNGSAMADINKKPRRLLDIIFSNIRNVCKIISDNCELKNGILFSTYLNIIFSYAKYLTEEEKIYVRNLFLSIDFKSLKYVSAKRIIIVYYKWLIFKYVS